MKAKMKKEEQSLKQRVLFAAMREFAEKGYLGASLADIGSRCNTSSALVCYHFKTKENLAQAVIDHLAAVVTIPKAVDPETLPNEGLYRAALKKFIADLVDLFQSTEEPLCYVAPLYRHEAANVRAKKGSLHDVILWPIFVELEKLIAAGVPGGDSITVRFWALAVWNIILGYVMKDPERVHLYFPEGMPSELFRQTAIDFLVDKVLLALRFDGKPGVDGFEG